MATLGDAELLFSQPREPGGNWPEPPDALLELPRKFFAIID